MLLLCVDFEAARKPIESFLADIADETGRLQLFGGRFLLVSKLSEGVDYETYDGNQ
jgi:hypothetical protein